MCSNRTPAVKLKVRNDPNQNLISFDRMSVALAEKRRAQRPDSLNGQRELSGSALAGSDEECTVTLRVRTLRISLEQHRLRIETIDAADVPPGKERNNRI